MQWTADIQKHFCTSVKLAACSSKRELFVHHVQHHRTGKGKSKQAQGHLSHLRAPGQTALLTAQVTHCALTEGTVVLSSGAQGRAGAACRAQGSGDALWRILLWLHRMHFKNHDTSDNSHPKLNIYWLSALRRIQELPQTTVKFKNTDTDTYCFSLQQSLFPHCPFLATPHCPFCCFTAKRRKK